ncbi:MAG: c-type cytochrome biogenesis protein CcmI [Nitrosomonadales bacterium]|nr:c-type cytochrome biogenesis protein CcmI [Nitrosomonadales bacterium]
MNTFWLMSAGLIALLSSAILFALLPWLRRTQKNAPGVAASGLAGKRAPIIIGSVAMILFAASLYLAWERPGAPSSVPSARNQNTTMAPEHVKAIDDLAARLKLNPDDGKGWAMLARTYAITGRYTEAVDAYEKAARLIQTDAVLLVDYADVLAMLNGKRMQGKPLELIRQALKIDPNNIKGLALMGTAAFQDGDYVRAEEYWNKLLPVLPPDSPLTGQIKAGIADAHALATGKSAPKPSSAGKPGSSGAQIAGVVKLSPALRDRVAPSDTVFVFAKAVSGSPMPIAVMRARVRDLPLKFVLDDSMAMMPAVKLSDHGNVTVSAKISRTGNATQQSGDLKGEISPVRMGADNVQIIIDSVVP